MLIILHADLFSISRPHGGPRSSSWALWARDRQYVGRDNIKSIPYGSIYRATTVTNVTYEHEYMYEYESNVFIRYLDRMAASGAHLGLYGHGTDDKSDVTT